VLRLGAVAFYELGSAGNSLDDMTLYHDAGIGLRMLIPQTSRELFRFDMALPLRPIPGNPVSPHFIAGFQSYF
jgi:outer membrane translocation and assembly module TamA